MYEFLQRIGRGLASVLAGLLVLSRRQSQGSLVLFAVSLIVLMFWPIAGCLMLTAIFWVAGAPPSQK